MKKKAKEGVLNALIKGGKGWTELRKELRISEPSLMVALRALTETNFVKKSWDKDSNKAVYVLTDMFRKSKTKEIGNEIAFDSLLERLEINYIISSRKFIRSVDIKEMINTIKRDKFSSRKLRRIQKKLLNVHERGNKPTAKEIGILSELFDFEIEYIKIKPESFRCVLSQS